mgnify:CR=1 FL=1
MGNLHQIKAFLEPKKLAMAGVSRNKKKFGYSVFNELRAKGFEIYPINPNADEIDGLKCYRSVAEIPADVEHLHIVTPKARSEELIRAAHEKGIRNIWIQQSSDTPEAVDFAKSNNINLIHKRCIMMYAEPVSGFHKAHLFLNKLFGLYPS